MTSTNWKEKNVPRLQLLGFAALAGVTMIGTLYAMDQVIKPYMKSISKYVSTAPYQVKTSVVAPSFSPNELRRILNPTPEYSQTNRHFGP
jgi:hypothetical protein